MSEKKQEDTEESPPPEPKQEKPTSTTLTNKQLIDNLDDTPESYYKIVSQILDSQEYKTLEESQEINDVDNIEELYNFPPDPENWKEEDLKELWADGPPFVLKPGWDPHDVDKDDLEAVNEEVVAGRGLPPFVAPFYVPYRKHYPVIPHNHYDIKNAKSVIEELDRIEEFLTWHSFVFQDGSTYVLVSFLAILISDNVDGFWFIGVARF
nr:protein TIC 100 [Tanacetum cinerariifolium]